MKDKMVIRIKKPTQPEALLWILVWLPLLNALLVELLGIPQIIIYTCDVAWLGLLGLLFLQRRPAGPSLKRLAYWVLAFFGFTVLVYIIQYQSVFYYLWGFRNNFRFFVAFIAAAYFWKEKQIVSFYKILDGCFWINFLVSLVQYFVFDISGDYLGGIFGIRAGSNGYSVIFLVIILAKSAIDFLEKRESIWKCGIRFVIAIILAAMAELKFFFVILVFIIVIALLITEFSWRKLILILGSLVGIAVGTALLARLFDGDSNWFTWEWMYSLAADDDGYTASGDLNRLNAIPKINELWLSSRGERLFGLGLGNCDTSEVAMLNTPFFERYGNMHYSWLSVGFMYLECGWLGLVFYFGFFILAFMEIRKIEKRSETSVRTYCRISRIVAAACLLILVYNGSMRMEAGYMVYFVLAVPFALREKPKRSGLPENSRECL